MGEATAARMGGAISRRGPLRLVVDNDPARAIDAEALPAASKRTR